jgi:glucokinase
MTTIIAADIGGSHITAAQVNLQQKQLVTASLSRCAVNSLAPAAGVLQQWAQCLLQAAQQQPIEQVCLAIPGPFDYREGICLMQDQSKYPALYRLNVKALLANVLQVARENIFLNNDAACFLEGEVFSGSMSGYSRVIGVTLGTGLGSAIYENGRAYSADRWQQPFKDGIAEDYLSGRWFLQQYAAITGKTVSGVKALAALAPDSDAVQRIFDAFGQQLAAFLIGFIKDAQAEAVVIGGNIARAYPLFKHTLIAGVYDQFPHVVIAPAALGEQAALMGAGSSWLHHPSI